MSLDRHPSISDWPTPCLRPAPASNTYQVIWNAPGEASGSLSSRAKVMFAGSVIGVIANYALIILVGVHDENEPPPVALS